ncbi:MAG: 50S ribosomal protein L10, partial [Chloroflexota bacterium]|nr:50S ribosomal protein L10 [Chloroflexota bacterium]
GFGFFYTQKRLAENQHFGGILPTQHKIDRVLDIKGRLERSSIAMTATYSGISVNQMIELRRAMKAGGVDFTIVKNTLLSLAADEAQKPQLKEIVQGPMAIALGYDDPIEAAKTVSDFARNGGTTLAVIGAVMGDGAAMSSSEFTRLASLPPKPIILAMLLGQLQSPIARLVTVMNGPMQSLGNVLAARVRQMEEEGPIPNSAIEPAADIREEPTDTAPEDESSEFESEVAPNNEDTEQASESAEDEDALDPGSEIESSEDEQKE